MKETIDLIEAYLNNELLGDALLSFENRMAIEPELVEEVSLHRQIRGFVKENEVESLKNQVKGWMVEDEVASPQPSSEEREQVRPKSKIFNINFMAKIAAGLAIISGLSWYFFSHKSIENRDNQYLTELINQSPPQLQGADDRTVWAQAYREKKYKTVIDILTKKHIKSTEELYYLGLALSADNQLDKAINQFSQKQITESVYAEKAEWAKALIYLKMYKKIEAKQILKKIENSDSEFNVRAKLIEL